MRPERRDDEGNEKKNRRKRKERSEGGRNEGIKKRKMVQDKRGRERNQ